MLIIKKLNNQLAYWKMKTLDYKRKQALVKIVKSWIVSDADVNNFLPTDQDRRNTKRLSSELERLLADSNSLSFRRMAKSLDWTNPNVSLIVELTLDDYLGNRLYRHGKKIALHLDTAARLNGELKKFIPLHHEKRSSKVMDSIDMLKIRWENSKI